jgi:nitrate reductase NapE component
VIARLALAAVLLMPRIAPACAVCFSGRDEARTAYVLTTVLLSLLPLGFVGGFLLWLRARSRALARAAQQRAAADGAAP